MPLASYITFAQKLPFPQRRERVAILLLGPDDKVKHVHWAEGARRSVNVSLASIEGLPGSSSFVTVHNHPSGVLRPSPKDLEAASQIARASQLLRLKPRAHLIYAKGKVARFGPTITVRVEDFPGETGAHTLKQAHELAKSIRKDGEKYPVALKRAWAQLREEGKAHFPGGHGVAHMQDAHTLAKRLRKSGEPYKDALKRAWAHLRQKPGGSTGVDRARDAPAGPTRGSADVPKASNGIPTTATGPDPTKEFSFNIRVVDLAELIPSHTDALGPNPDYPKELQPRIRERAASRLQIDEIARNLEPKALVADSGTLDRGMPIVGPDMVVESGNGRVLALRRARAEYPARWKGYAAYVRYTARSLYQGLPRDAPDPVLVRVRTTNADRVAFTAMANEAATLTMSPLEQALQDSGRISDLALASLVVGESQSVDQALQAASNRQIVGHFIGNLAANERAALVGAAGELNTLGLQRLKAALFAKVYPGEAGHRLTKAFVESLDPVVKNMEAAMFDALAASAKAEGLIRASDRVADLSLGEDVAKAVDMLARLKQTGTVASDYIRQTSAFGRELDPSQERLLVFLEANGRSRKVLREFLQEYAAAVVASPHPSQGSMFGGAGESKDAVVSRLIEAQTKKGSTGALFNLIAARQAVGFADPLRRGHWGGVTLSDIDVGGVHRGRTSISAA